MKTAMKVTRVSVVEIEGLGAMIREARKQSGKKVKTLADEAGMSTVHWHDIEGEKLRNSLPEETLRRMESALGIEFGVEFGTND